MARRVSVTQANDDDLYLGCCLVIGQARNVEEEVLWLLRESIVSYGFKLPDNDWMLHALLCDVITMWEFEQWARRNNLFVHGEDVISFGDVIRLADTQEPTVRLSPVWVSIDGVSHMIYRNGTHLVHFTNDNVDWHCAEEVVLCH